MHQHDRPIAFGERRRQQRSRHRPDTNCQICVKSLPGIAASARCHTSDTDVGDRGGGAGAGHRVEEQAHVLGHQTGVEAGVVRAGDDAVGELVDGRRVAPGRHVEHVEDDAHVEPFGDTERDRLRRGGQRRRREVVVEQLHRLALPGACPDVEHVAGDRLEDRTVRLEDLGGSGEHHRDRGRACTRHAARHRTVGVRDAEARRVVPRPRRRPAARPSRGRRRW